MNLDPSGALARLVRMIFDKNAADLYVSFPCRVISYNEQTGLAVVQPLMRGETDDPAPIQDVPTLGNKYRVGGTVQTYIPVYSPGDIVLVVCCDAEIKNALNGQIATADSKRRHSLNDAVIVGVFPCNL
jgi:hypothetical protein